MDFPFFSIIVGVYNVKKYFDRGVKQLLTQTFPDFELILVDDGSTDGCSELCEVWGQKDDRIVVIHKKNGGLGSARNAGLDIARGKYVWSFDMDDEIEPDVLERLYGYAKDLSVEVFCFGYREHDLSAGTCRDYTFPLKSCFCNAEVRDAYIDLLYGLSFHNGFFWNKLYLRSFLEKYQFRFDSLSIQQDEVFNLKMYRVVNRLEFIPGTFYHYYVYTIGNNRSRFIPNRYDIMKKVRFSFEDLRSYWNLEDPRWLGLMNSRFYKSVIPCLTSNLFHKNSSWNWKRKKAELLRITQDPEAKDALCFAKNNYKNIDTQLIIWAIFQDSIVILYLIYCFLAQKQKVKHFIKALLPSIN